MNSASKTVTLEKRGGIFHIFLSLLLLLIILLFVFYLFKVPFIDSLKFFLAVLFVVYIPGQALIWLARIKGTKLEIVTLSFVIGMSSSTLIYRISELIHFLPLFLVWLVILTIGFFYRLIKKPPKKEDFEFRLSWRGILFILIAFLVFYSLFIDNYRNGIVRPDGSVSLNMHYYDGFRRTAMVREIAHSIPPQMPFASGLPLSYHHGMETFVAMLYKHFNLGVLDLLHRFTMTFYFALLLLTLYIFARKWIGPNRALLGMFLVLFGSGGLGFVGGLLSKYPGYWGKLFYSFYFLDLVCVNPYLPALSVLFAGFFCLQKYIKLRKFSWVVMASFLLAILVEYKMILAFPVLGALGLSGFVYLFRYRMKIALNALILTCLMMGPLLFLAYYHNIKGPQYLPEIGLNNWIIFTLVDLKLFFLARPWGELTRHFQLTLLNLSAFFPILLGFFVGSFGLSFFALPRMIKDFFRSRKNHLMNFFLIAFFMMGIVIFFGFNPSLGGRSINWMNIFVYYSSVIILVLFWSDRVILFCERRRRITRILIVFLVVVFSVPNVVQFLWAKTAYPQKRIISRYHLDACEWLNENTEDISVVLHSKNINYVCYFADRRVVLDTSAHSYLAFHLTPRQIQERQKDRLRFFSDPVGNADVLSKYNVSHVWIVADKDFIDVERQKDGKIDFFTTAKSLSMILVYKNRYFSIYEVERHD